MQILSLFFVIFLSFIVFFFVFFFTEFFVILWLYVVLSCVCVCVFPPGHGYCHQTGRNGRMPTDGHTMLTTVPACRSGTFPAGQYIATLSGLVTCLLSCLMCAIGPCWVVCAVLCAPCTRQMDIVQRCFAFTETLQTIRDGEPRSATSTFTQLLSSADRQMFTFSVYFVQSNEVHWCPCKVVKVLLGCVKCFK